MFPIDIFEKWMFLDFFCSRRSNNSSLERTKTRICIYILPIHPKRLSTSRWSNPSNKVRISFDIVSGNSIDCYKERKENAVWDFPSLSLGKSFYHCHGHFINFVFIFRFMLTKWTVSIKKKRNKHDWSICRNLRVCLIVSSLTMKCKHTLWVVYRAYIQRKTNQHLNHTQHLWLRLPEPYSHVFPHLHGVFSWKNHKLNLNLRCERDHVHQVGYLQAKKKQSFNRSSFAIRNLTLRSR